MGNYEPLIGIDEPKRQEVIQLAEDEGVSYEQARQALEACGYDLAEAAKALAA